MKLFTEALGKKQQALLRRVGPFLTGRGFYLGGGTAVALQLGHRRSVDFDWFTPARIPDPLLLGGDLRKEGNHFVMGQVDRGTLHCTISGVRLSLFEYRYPLLKPLVRAAAFACQLASPVDLAAMKLASVAQRGAKKDFVDIYALIERGQPLGELMASYARKYAAVDQGHLLYSLSYFEDADRERMPTMLWRVDWRAIKKRIQGCVRAAASS
jgi:hypothetical protein